MAVLAERIACIGVFLQVWQEKRGKWGKMMPYLLEMWATECLAASTAGEQLWPGIRERKPNAKGTVLNANRTVPYALFFKKMKKKVSLRKEFEVWDTNCMNELQKQMNCLEIEFTFKSPI
jgi:hypothetical protein